MGVVDAAVDDRDPLALADQSEGLPGPVNAGESGRSCVVEPDRPGDLHPLHPGHGSERVQISDLDPDPYRVEHGGDLADGRGPGRAKSWQQGVLLGPDLAYGGLALALGRLGGRLASEFDHGVDHLVRVALRREVDHGAELGAVDPLEALARFAWVGVAGESGQRGECDDDGQDEGWGLHGE